MIKGGGWFVVNVCHCTMSVGRYRKCHRTKPVHSYTSGIIMCFFEGGGRQVRDDSHSQLEIIALESRISEYIETRNIVRVQNVTLRW